MKNIVHYLTPAKTCATIALISTIWLGSNLTDLIRVEKARYAPQFKQANALFEAVRYGERYSLATALAANRYFEFMEANPQIEQDYFKIIDERRLVRNKAFASLFFLTSSSLAGFCFSTKR